MKNCHLMVDSLKEVSSLNLLYVRVDSPCGIKEALGFDFWNIKRKHLHL